MRCEEFFRVNALNPKRCKELLKLPTAEVLAFENESASEHSPGPVQNDEHLWRQMLNPTHFDVAKNQLKVTAFDDVTRIGGSVNRGFANFDTLVEAAKRRVDTINARGKPPEVKLLQLVRLECKAVRAITTTVNTGGVEIRGFIVVDTAKADDASHADICQIVSQPEQGRSVRSALLDLANKYLSEGVTA